jgi:transcriptional regulator with XRE-family HTH domain
MEDDWRKTLRAIRRRMGQSLRETADLAGLSYEAVRGYENGRRNPRREHLLAVLRAMDARQVEVNEVLRLAGFAEIETLFPLAENPSYFFRPEELDAAVETVPWPQFVVSDAVEVLAANQAMQAVWDVDLEYERSWRTRAQMNTLSVASDRHFADRVVNWEEVVGVLAGVHKGRPYGGPSLDEPTPLLTEVLAEFAKGDPTFLKRLIEVWTSAVPWPAKVRQQYRVVWSDAGYGEMRFLAQITTASEPAGLAFNDWHPVDAETWTVLELVKKRWHASPPARRQR